MQKNIKLIIWAIVLVVIIIAGVRVFSSEDSWICEDGEWIAHGHPSKDKPAEDCKKEVVDNNINNMEELKIEVLKEGEGERQIKAGETAVVHYTGWLTNGDKFDSSVDRGQLFEFPLGAGRVIPGWDQGVAGMKIGEKRKLTIPSDLAYGDNGMPPIIPGKATLIFEVELFEIK